MIRLKAFALLLLFSAPSAALAQSFDPTSFTAAGNGCVPATFAATATDVEPFDLRIIFQSFRASNWGTVFCNIRMRALLPGGAIYQLRLHRFIDTLLEGTLAPSQARLRQTGTFAGMSLRNIDVRLGGPSGPSTIHRADDLLINRCASSLASVSFDLKTTVMAPVGFDLSVGKLDFRFEQVLVLPCGS